MSICSSDDELTSQINTQSAVYPAGDTHKAEELAFDDFDKSDSSDSLLYDFTSSPLLSDPNQDSELSLAEMKLSDASGVDVDALDLSLEAASDDDLLLIQTPVPRNASDVMDSDDELLFMSPVPAQSQTAPQSQISAPALSVSSSTKPSKPKKVMRKKAAALASPPSPAQTPKEASRNRRELARMPSPPSIPVLRPTLPLQQIALDNQPTESNGPSNDLQPIVLVEQADSQQPKAKRKAGKNAALKQGKRKAFIVNFNDEQTPEERRTAVVQSLSSIVLSLVLQLTLSLESEASESEHEESTQTQTQSQQTVRKRKRKQPKPKIVSFPLASPISVELMGRTKENKLKKVVFPRRTGKGTGHGAKELAILVRLIELIIDGLGANTISTKRDLYYKDVALFGKQSVVDQLVDDLAATLGCRRFDLNIVAASKGLISGACVMHLKHGKMADARQSTQLISPKELIEDIEVDEARFVLVVEKEAVFQTLRAAPFMQEGGIVMTGKGYPDVATRELVKYFSDTLPENVPILCLVDGDPHGIDILSTYRFGSNGMAFDNENLAAKRVEWLGLKVADLQELDITADHMLAMTAIDRKKAFAMLQKEHLPAEWKQELQIMLHLHRKAEIEILSAEAGEQDGLIRYVEACITKRLSVESQ